MHLLRCSISHGGCTKITDFISPFCIYDTKGKLCIRGVGEEKIYPTRDWLAGSSLSCFDW